MTALKTHIKYFLSTNECALDIPKDAPLDWEKIAAQIVKILPHRKRTLGVYTCLLLQFDGYRSGEECRKIWENKLHPSINKKKFSLKEDVFLKEAVFEYPEDCETHDWEDIAKEMNTGRTDLQCMQRWVSYIRPRLFPIKWSTEDSQRLQDLVSKFQFGDIIPWAQLAKSLPGFTVAQLQSKWRNINPDFRKGPFTMDEDLKLANVKNCFRSVYLIFHNLFQFQGLWVFGMNFEMIAFNILGRNKAQVRDRFKSTIFPSLTSNPWTV